MDSGDKESGAATLTRMTDPSLLGGVDTKKLGRQLPLSLGGGD